MKVKKHGNSNHKKVESVLRDEEVKEVFRKFYKNVQEHGAEAVLQAIRDKWEQIEEEWRNEGAEDTWDLSGIRHEHEETLKRNALFLIESSEKITDYDPKVLKEMKMAYELEDYDDVLDLAYLHDRKKRVKQARETKLKAEPTASAELNRPFTHAMTTLIEAIAAEENSEETAIQSCVSALRHLSRDLTYEERSAAKEDIRKAIQLLG